MSRTIGQRLREALEKIGMSMSALSEQSQIKYNSIQNYVADRQKPGADALIKIASSTKINIHWLLTGAGPVFRDTVRLAPKEMSVSDYIDIRNKFMDFDAKFSLNPDIIWHSGTADGQKMHRFCLLNAVKFFADYKEADIEAITGSKRLDDLSNEALLNVLYRVSGEELPDGSRQGSQ